jgi:serine/threonine protein kinase/Tol biopolymer transport system component
MTGDRIGAFEIRELLGAGGMGEVYRARDTRLGRDVAIKIIAASFTRDPVRRARFEREARLLASLNHPGIATLYGVEDRPDGLALVMELVEGQTLADRIAFGRLGIDDALDIAGQVAEGLEAAHERGVVHRDLKPSNIAIRSDGMVKVLDFGLAKALGAGDADEAGTTTTLTGTVDAVGPGTPAYMSPEQARGLAVDMRTDVWAFGCVLYEMLTGRRAFMGDRTSDVIAKVLEREPDFDQLPPDVPETIRRLLRRCLAKDPQDRLRDIGDARLDLRDRAAVEGASEKARDGGRRAIPSRWRWSAAAVVTLAAGAAVARARMGGRPPSPPGPRDPPTTVQLPHGSSITRGPGVASSVAVSPDGRTIVVATTDAGGQRLYQRPIDRLEATPIQGTERGSSPFFSWDGAWIGFAADGWLKRVPAGGGGAVNIVRLAGFPAGASWGPDDRIVFAHGADASLQVVDARGGQAEVLIPGQRAYRPEVLPDGNTVLYESGGWVHAFDRQTGRKTQLARGGAPRFANGQVIVVDQDTLLAASFEPSRHEIGPMDPLVERAAVEAATIGVMAHYAVSREGTLVYVPAHDMFSLVVVQADGTEHRVTDDQFRFHNPRFSPDGERVVVAARRRADEPSDLWLHDLRTSVSTRLTFDGASRPFWGPGDDTITYSRPLPSQGSGIYTIPADGGSGVRQILPLSSIHWLVGWTRAPRTLVYGVMEGTPSSIIALTESRPARRVIGPAAAWGGRLSPDGRWLAYSSLDSGNFQVLVTPFPAGAPQWPIADGTDPAWSPEGQEVYYRSGSRLMAARIDITGGVVRAPSHRVAHEPFQPPTYDDYDIHRDGRTLVLVRPANPVQLREVSVTRNWQAQRNPRTRENDRKH